MKIQLLLLIICICSTQTFYSQEDDGVVSLALPTRNSITFNRFTINPTFSFVREQTKYISFYNKREWVQFDDAPVTYLASYSGRFGENIGAGLGLFQQNYGVLTTFGGILNFAYNARLGRDNNLTFGLNVGAYKSGVNTANVVTNFSDPSLQNVPENFLLTINPGINYGTEFFDFGVSINNLALYNFVSSELIQDNPQQSIQAHLMYTGYMDSRGFFNDSKFTGLLRSEFQQDETIISGVAMVTVPKGIWAQAGYNTLYGAFGGIGLNITSQVAIEYNYETALGDLQIFGPSHEFTLAYRFKNNNYYDYNREDEVSGILSSDTKRRRVSNKSKPKTNTSNKLAQEKRAAALAEQKTKKEAETERRLIAKQKAEEQAKLKAQQVAEEEVKKAEAELAEAQKTQSEADKNAAMQAEADANTKLLAEQKVKEEAVKKAKEIAETRARLLAEEKAKEDAAAQSQLLAEEKAKEEAATQAQRLAEQREKEEAAAQAQLLAEQKAKQDAEAQAQLLAEQKAKEEAAAQAQLLAEQKAEQEAEAQAQGLAQQKAEEEAIAQAQLLAEQTAKREAEAQAQGLAEQKAKEEAAAQAQLLAEAQAKRLAQQKAEEEAIAQAQLLAKQKAKEDAEAKNAAEDLITNPKDELGQSMQTLAIETDEAKVAQTQLLKEFDDIIAIKDEDLKNLKEENDLSDQGIAVKPRPFKSVTAENNKLSAIKADLDRVIKARSESIEDLKALYEQRTRIQNTELDEVNLFYKNKIERLTEEQAKAVQTRSRLNSRLETIRVATEFEKRRRIKKAAYENEEDRLFQDKATLQNIKTTTALSTTPLKVEDFDFGEDQGNSIKILKNIKNVESGYYVVIAVHNDIKKRNDFVTNVVASGKTDVDFFYDVNTSKYYIYADKFENIDNANQALKSRLNKPYNTKMSLIKIEN